MSKVLAAQEGFHGPSIELFNWPCIGPEFGSAFGYPICLNRVGIAMIIGALVIVAMFASAFRSPRLVPRGFQNVMEVGVDFVRRSVVLEVLGPKGLKYMPYFLAVFFFVFIGNVMGVIPPFMFPVNSVIAVPALLAVCSWLLFNIVGIKEQGLGPYLRNNLFPPGVPAWVYPLVTPIELVSTFVLRPFTLAVRLLANMIAGHLVLSLFFLGAFYLAARPATFIFGLGSFAAGVVFVMFELLVAVLQAYIFVILTAVYVAGAIEPEH